MNYFLSAFLNVCCFLMLACSSNHDEHTQTSNLEVYTDIDGNANLDTLILIFKEDGNGYDMGMPCGYMNQNGDTIIPVGRYSACFSDTITTFGIVIEEGIANSKPIGIDTKGNMLYEVYWYDNGPDYTVDGLFRIKKNGKIGYADTLGKVVIEPQFDCASPFEEGKARVAYECTIVKDKHDEHQTTESDAWFFIDKTGKKLE